MKDIKGMKNGHLECLEILPARMTSDGRKCRYVKVKCDCGNIKEIRKSSFTSGRQIHCGFDCEMKIKKHRCHIGKTYGSYTVLSVVEKQKGGLKRALVRVQCQCGKEREMSLSTLVNGYNQKCLTCSNVDKRIKVEKGTCFDRWTVKDSYVDEKGFTQAICVCTCGTERTIRLHNLTRKKKNEETERSCGCARRLDLTNRVFGRLTVKRESETIYKVYNGKKVAKRMWLCSCECGTEEKIVHQGELMEGHTKSCGCLMSSEERRERVKGEKNPMFGRTGEKNPVWKPERTHEQRVKERKDNRYYVWRKVVYERDRYRCKCCGDDKGGNLVAHHVFNYADFPHLRYHVGNGITLCTRCHNGFHSLYGKNRNTAKQLEEYLNKCMNTTAFLSIREILQSTEVIGDGSRRIKPYTVQFPNGKKKDFYTYEEIRKEAGIPITSSLKSVLHHQPYERTKIVALRGKTKEKEFESFQQAGRYYGCSGSTLIRYIGKEYEDERIKGLKGIRFEKITERYLVTRKNEVGIDTQTK